MTTYKIVRFFLNGDRQIIKTEMTLEEVQEHCKDPETSSNTCTKKEGLERTAKEGMWFDGYEEE